MHRSRISAICIDVPASQRAETEAFWSAALGAPSRRGEHHPEYSTLGTVNGHVMLIQALGAGSSRVHLDVHTDDLVAEVRRLVDLGARELDRHDTWAILEDPAGVVFCVVPVEPGDATLVDAATWS